MAVPELPQDFKEFLKLLNDLEVKYLLVGGYAVKPARAAFHKRSVQCDLRQFGRRLRNIIGPHRVTVC